MSVTRLIFAASVLFAFVSPVLANDQAQRTKQYRPLEAKAVSIETGARVTAASQKQGAAASTLRKAWAHFDLREWDDAHDAFYSVLEMDAENVPAAEGLAMSLYQSGDCASALRVGKDLQDSMPSVQRIVEETILADVRHMVRKGELDAAEKFLDIFPVDSKKVAQARQMVADATIITTATGPDGDVTTEPVTSGAAKTKLVRN